jgi:DNA-binding protein H-NS
MLSGHDHARAAVWSWKAAESGRLSKTCARHPESSPSGIDHTSHDHCPMKSGPHRHNSRPIGGRSMTVSLSDLIAQREEIDRQIREAKLAKKSEAIVRIRELMSVHQLTTTDLTVKSSARAPGVSGKKVAPKYRDPDSGATWTGRGLKPKWLSAALKAGKSITDFAI